MRVAAIDLGSNTFHLLIVEGKDGQIAKEVYRRRIFVGLGDGGIDILETDAIDRGLGACLEFRKAVKEAGVEKIKVTGTAALRNASNAAEFILKAEALLGAKIDVIDGNLEARYIFEGVKLLSDLTRTTLIADIGGGSTEFILASNGKIIWAQSFLLGVGVMHAAYHKSEPIRSEDELALRLHIRNTLQPLAVQLNQHKAEVFIGASGSFEVLESMTGKPSYKNMLNALDVRDAYKIASLIITKNLEERRQLPGMPEERIKLIVVAMVLIDEILQLTGEVQLNVTPYALKEGLIAELLSKASDT